MNRSNFGANTNTVRIMIDAGLLFLAHSIALLIMGQKLSHTEFIQFTVLDVIFSLIYLLSNKESYLYNVTMFFYLDRVFKKVMKSFLVAAASTATIMFLLLENENGRVFYLWFMGIALVTIVINVLLYRPINKRLTKYHAPRTAFIGKKSSFDKFRGFLSKTSISLKFVGFIALDKEQMDDSGDYIGCLEELETLIKQYNLDQVYIMQKKGEQLTYTQDYIDLCISMGVTVRLVVDFYKSRRADSFVSTVGTYPIITYHTITLNATEQLVKRIMDIIGGIAGIILASPIMLITAIAIKLDSPGPVLFCQTRVGQNGRYFKIYKFRSMYIDAEERKKELMAQNEIQGGVMFKMKNDPRITRVGRIIRKLSIDELPQFFNIVQGTMSLVGTRPPTLDEVEKYKTDQWRRISIKPGLTGMWQVSGRSNVLDFDEIVQMDVEYIDNWTIFEDIKILFKTVWVVLKHSDAC